MRSCWGESEIAQAIGLMLQYYPVQCKGTLTFQPIRWMFSGKVSLLRCAGTKALVQSGLELFWKKVAGPMTMIMMACSSGGSTLRTLPFGARPTRALKTFCYEWAV